MENDDEDEDYEDDADFARAEASKGRGDSGAAAADMNDENGENGENEEEDYVDEEQMLDVAEKCFMKIAEAIIARGLTVRQAFKGLILEEPIETEEGESQVIELLSPMAFLEGIKNLGLTDLEEMEIACLMRVLTKADLENAILLRELIVIMENFGI